MIRGVGFFVLSILYSSYSRDDSMLKKFRYWELGFILIERRLGIRVSLHIRIGLRD